MPPHVALRLTMCNALAMPDPDPIGSQEACALLGIDRSTLSRWVAAGKLKPITQLPGRSGPFLFDRAEIEARAEEMASASNESASVPSVAAS